MSGDKIRKDSNTTRLRNELDGLMNGFNETFARKEGERDISDMIGKKLNEIAKPAKTYDYDMDELDLQFKKKATELINSMFDFYLDAGIIDRMEYAKHKKNLDTSNLSNMLWQLKTVKITISILMDEVLSGNTNDKTIASLAGMQDRFTDIIKTQANYMLFLEDTYKKMKYEDVKQLAGPDNADSAVLDAHREVATSSDYYLTANPKDLVHQITEVAPLTDEEREDMVKEGAECMSLETTKKNTDPKLKEELMSELDVKIEKNEEKTDNYDSILNMI